MTKVKFFETSNIFKLEEQVNEFLKEIDDMSVLEIRFSNISSHLPQYTDDDWNLIYNAMVVYDEIDNFDVPERSDSFMGSTTAIRKNM